MKENDSEELSDSLFLYFIASSFNSDYTKIIPRGVARFLQFAVAVLYPYHPSYSSNIEVP